MGHGQVKILGGQGQRAKYWEIKVRSQNIRGQNISGQSEGQSQGPRSGDKNQRSGSGVNVGGQDNGSQGQWSYVIGQDIRGHGQEVKVRGHDRGQGQEVKIREQKSGGQGQGKVMGSRPGINVKDQDNGSQGQGGVNVRGQCRISGRLRCCLFIWRSWGSQMRGTHRHFQVTKSLV